jgi:tetratricopeptide (TPR) repeat protein
MFSQISEEIKELVENAKSLECIGRYEEAAEVLSVYWKNRNEYPDVSELNKAEQAEILLRCGSLAGYIGSCKQKKDAQKLAQDLIFEASKILWLSQDIEKRAECENCLALTYWRLGQLDEARSFITSAFKHEIDKTCEVRLQTYVLDIKILFDEGKYQEIVNKCKALDNLFLKSSFLVLKGNFNNSYAYGLMKIGDKYTALSRFDLAKRFYSDAKHYLNSALVDNNLAIFFKNEKDYHHAHKAAISAQENFKKLGDKTREGYSLDTRAQIYLAQGKYEEALKCVNEAIMMLSEGDNYCYRANTYQTKSEIELSMNNLQESFETIIRSIHIANLHVSNEQAKKFIDEYIELLKNRGLK